MGHRRTYSQDCDLTSNPPDMIPPSLAAKILEKEIELNNRVSSAVVLELTILYTKAIECCPLSIYYSNRGQAYIFLNQYDNALEDARKSRSIDPKNAKALLREAQVLSLIGKKIEAAGCYWHALKLDQNPNITAVFLSTLDSF